MDNILYELNPLQKEAVTFGDGPLLVIAGAGTGKTTVITRRIAYLITSKKARPEEILALTFTEKSATEMEERVDLLVPYGYANIWISTFHAFGNRILRDHALDLGLSPDFRLLTRPEQIIFFREHLFEFPLNYYRPLGDPTRYIDAIIALISRAMDEDISPNEYLNYVSDLKRRYEKGYQEGSTEEVMREGEIAETYSRYQELKAKNGFLDFGDLVNLTLKLFRDNQRIRKGYQDRFRYILVDEFQDTNYAQFQLLKLLVGNHNITVVGDDDQSIYKFRGAAISNILGFKDIYPDAREIVLTQNYRSTQIVLDSARRLICHNNPDRLEVRNNIDKRLISQNPRGIPIKHLHYDTLSNEADGVADIIEEGVTLREYTYKEFAILVRSNNDADPFLRSLNMKGIPYHFSGGQGLYSRPEIRLVISFLKVITNFNDNMNLYHLSSSDIYQLNGMDLTLCMNKASEINSSLYYIFSHLEDLSDLKDISSDSCATISKILEDIRYNVKASIEVPTSSLLYNFLKNSGYLTRLISSPSMENEKKIINIAKFFDIVQSSERIIMNGNVRGFISHIDMLIKSGDDPPVADVERDTDAVNVLTVHKAKGLEFPVVFMVSLLAQRFPSRHRNEPIPLPIALIKDILPSGDFHLQEERRLFYVAMTRAMKELYLTSGVDYGGLRKRKVSQFVLEAMDLPVVDKTLLKRSAIESIERFAPPVRGDNLTPHYDYSAGEIPRADKDVCPMEGGLKLSYYQIDDYLTCPLKYKYVHILRVPIIKHHSIIYGKALHTAVSEYNRRKINGHSIEEEGLIKIFEDAWTSEGFLTREHEEMRLESGWRALRDFYHREEDRGIIPAYVEKEFSFPLPCINTVRGLGDIRIQGRWDRIDIYDEDISIIDFKSSDIYTQKDADRRSKDSLQLSIYALAYREIYGKIPDRLELYFLESGLIGVSMRKEDDLNKIIDKIGEVASGIRARNYEANPDYIACRYCAFLEICPHMEKR
ncbi:MAG: ATP-dependent helicase [Nitrospinae bacterium]|nr:ATP-dependent helicase [Nitrospinota bacterium]